MPDLVAALNRTRVKCNRSCRILETAGDSEAKLERNGSMTLIRAWAIPVACLLRVPLLVLLAGSFRRQSSKWIQEAAVVGTGLENGTFPSLGGPKDRLLHGLLAAGFDEQSCLSRYQSVLYRKESPHVPSSYLVEKLRNYEALHKKCGPNTELYKKAVEQLKSDHGTQSTECNYVIWISYSGLGNKMLSIASAFLYALLTNRVLFIDRGFDMADLFCEPFPESSWLLPLDFPINEFDTFDMKTPKSYGNMLKDKVIGNGDDGTSTHSLPDYIYLHLSHDYGDYDKLFFCEDDQRFLRFVPWLLLRSNNYFVPSLFMIPTYEEELKHLFPEKDTVFHHLGRYLFHPTNSVWGLITRYYQSYLANADERVGIQVRTFETDAGPFQYVLDQILACAQKAKLLPDASGQDTVVSTPKTKSKAVLMTSLNSGYSENIRNMYWEHPTVTGEIISVYQPSHEGYQQTEKQMHDMKALAEIYLLSLTDALVTSAWSTFGYVAQGLGGLRPWILFKPENHTAPDPPCRQAMSIEPCFHAPPFYDCKAKTGADTGALVPYVRHCEDMSWGLKVVDQNEW
ncbi:galactoside 2-alpha-L-fucosyltransferase-like isoform X2 [Musa acuminata AAA Group]|uniref:galactoside 2-alpha-L-fucosyltransferase-like isoform X2 n=1 Tax=Musa acuminata AAA Group TaxID=214697 RepID=UPI0031D2F890